jgi:hypothetical protein
MQTLDYLLPQPPFDLPFEKQLAFNGLIQATPAGAWLDYRLPYPKWQFLTYLCQTRPVVLHGSMNTAIAVVEPRAAQDIKAFSAQEAIYATTDGIFGVYFAMIDRQRFQPLSLFETCLSIKTTAGETLGPLYFFSITRSALLQEPWCEGAVYILPDQNFEQDPTLAIAGAQIVLAQCASQHTAVPLAKLRVGPQDFPFLSQIHGHDDVILNRLAAADPNGFPWPEAWQA